MPSNGISISSAISAQHTHMPNAKKTNTDHATCGMTSWQLTQPQSQNSNLASGLNIQVGLGRSASALCISPHLTSLEHSHTLNGPMSGTTRVSRYQKGITDPDFTEARDSEWQWHQLDHMQVCTSLQTDNHASTPSLTFLQAGCPS